MSKTSKIKYPKLTQKTYKALSYLAIFGLLGNLALGVKIPFFGLPAPYNNKLYTGPAQAEVNIIIETDREEGLILVANSSPQLDGQTFFKEHELATIQGITIIQISSPELLVSFQKLESDSTNESRYFGSGQRVIVTAYSSTPDQTDTSPFITANGSWVRDGIIACNFLPFGTKVKFSDIFGDKIFVVEDRMAKRNSHKMDIWMPSRWQALQFGVQYLAYEIVR